MMSREFIILKKTDEVVYSWLSACDILRKKLRAIDHRGMGVAKTHGGRDEWAWSVTQHHLPTSYQTSYTELLVFSFTLCCARTVHLRRHVRRC